MPEIADGTVEIKAIAREPGDRTKLAVWSKDEKVDCVGACVGMRGTRVKNIVRELHGEKIDIIRWHDNVSEFIGAALAPATIAAIEADPAPRRAVVLVENDQLSLAIGKKGQNVRLASKLTGWELEIKSRLQQGGASGALRELKGVGPAMEERLKAAGIETVAHLAERTVAQLTAIEGIGEKTAEKLIEMAKAAHAAVSDSGAADASGAAPQSDAPAADRSDGTNGSEAA